jgi:hypothetical protein
MSKKCISRGYMRVYVGLIMLAASRFPCFLLVSGVWDISSGIGLYKFYANARRKRVIQRQPLLVQYPQQQANPILSMNNYTRETVPFKVTGQRKYLYFEAPFISNTVESIMFLYDRTEKLFWYYFFLLF